MLGSILGQILARAASGRAAPLRLRLRRIDIGDILGGLGGLLGGGTKN